LESAGDYFFLAGKTHNGTVRGIFRGGRDLSLSLSLSLGHKITNVPLIWKVWDIIFIFLSKTHKGTVLGIFRGGLDLFDPKIALRYAQDNLGVKKVSAPSKNPSNCPIISFAR
jgi:hypothetical protein